MTIMQKTPRSTTRLKPVDLISVYTASRSRTEPMQCTNLTSRVVWAPFTLNSDLKVCSQWLMRPRFSLTGGLLFN